MGHDFRPLQNLAARARVVLAAIEGGDPIAYDLMVTLAEELPARDERLGKRALVLLTAIEAGDEIAHDLMLQLAKDLVCVGDEGAAAGTDSNEHDASMRQPPRATFGRLRSPHVVQRGNADAKREVVHAAFVPLDAPEGALLALAALVREAM